MNFVRGIQYEVRSKKAAFNNPKENPVGAALIVFG